MIAYLRFISPVVFIALSLSLAAQEKIALQIHISDRPEKTPKQINEVQSVSYRSAFEIQHVLKSLVKDLYQEGYLSASVDSVIGDSAKMTAFIFLGPRFTISHLDVSEVDEDILSKTGFRDKLYTDRPLKPNMIGRFFDDALTYLENNGYPFATIRLDSIVAENNRVSAKVVVEKNKFITIDSIVILGDKIRLNKHYISNVIGIKPGSPYRENVVSKIGLLIAEDPFVKELSPFEVIFTDKSTRLVLILTKQKASNFDGILGIQPQGNTGKVIITGDVKLGLGNIVGLGEKLNLRWQRLRDKTQQINVSLDIPFLFRTPIGIGYKLEIYRRDTSFNNVEHLLSIPFYINNGSRFKGYFRYFKSSLISLSGYENATSLPPYLDSKATTYGIGYEITRYDYRLNPSKGWALNVTAGAGTNEILRNQGLENINYDSLGGKATKLEGALDFHYFIHIKGPSTILLRAQAGGMTGDNLSLNQLTRIGGLLTLRGFDEQSIIVSTYGVATAEYRFLFERESYFSLFIDYGWYERNVIDGYFSDMPFGFGVGISFATKAGIFSLNYALGTQQGNPIDFRTGKIHFGFVNYF